MSEDHDFYCLSCDRWTTIEIQCPYCEHNYTLKENEGKPTEVGASKEEK